MDNKDIYSKLMVLYNNLLTENQKIYVKLEQIFLILDATTSPELILDATTSSPELQNNNVS